MKIKYIISLSALVALMVTSCWGGDAARNQVLALMASKLSQNFVRVNFGVRDRYGDWTYHGGHTYGIGTSLGDVKKDFGENYITYTGGGVSIWDLGLSAVSPFGVRVSPNDLTINVNGVDEPDDNYKLKEGDKVIIF